MRTFTGGALLAPIRILAVTIAVCGCLFLPLPGAAQAMSRTGNDIAQPIRKHHPARLQPRPEAVPSDEAAPAAKPEAKKPIAPEGKPSGRDAKPDDEEEVSPGDNPASCEGCELAGLVVVGGSLWGLFGVSRRRGVPRPVIRGLQPR